MTSLVKAVANIVLFILAPVAVVWVQARLAMAIETIGGSSTGEAETRYLWNWKS
jgi:hypothetical protein